MFNDTKSYEVTDCREPSGACHTHQVAVERWRISGDAGLTLGRVRIATNLSATESSAARLIFRTADVFPFPTKSNYGAQGASNFSIFF